MKAPEVPARGRGGAGAAVVAGRPAGALAAALGLTCFALWLAGVLGRPVPAGVVSAAVGAAGVAVLAWVGLRFAVATAVPGNHRRRTLALAAVLAVALVVRFTGLGHELVDRPYLDEGTYYTHAVQINAGEPFSASFVYPHLLYYADAFVLWAAEPFRPALARALGVDDPVALSWLLLRALVALLGALTVWPVFRIAEAVMGAEDGRGLAAPVLAGLLVAFAPLYNEIAHLNIADLPSAFFATVCLAACARVLEGESAGRYLAAGVAAGLAAASKYPAGVVAVAVVGVWLGHRFGVGAGTGTGAGAGLPEDGAGRCPRRGAAPPSRRARGGLRCASAAADGQPDEATSGDAAPEHPAPGTPPRPSPGRKDGGEKRGRAERWEGRAGSGTALASAPGESSTGGGGKGAVGEGGGASGPREGRAEMSPQGSVGSAFGEGGSGEGEGSSASGPHRPVRTDETAGSGRSGAAGRSGLWGSTGGLLLAGLAALAVFVATMPSLLVFPEQAFGGGRGIFFGVRQYGGGGWIGVQPDSNALFYGRVILRELGLPAVLAGVAGLAFLRRRQAVRLAWLLPFPVTYLLLVVAMNMVVRRNLLPAVPALAALLAVGAAALWRRALEPILDRVVARLHKRGRNGDRADAVPATARGPGGGAGSTGRPGEADRGRSGDPERGRPGKAPAAPPGASGGAGVLPKRLAAAVLLLLLVAPPALRSVADSVAMARPSTREQARAWLLAHAAPGSAVLRESYGPELPAERFAVWKSRFAARFPLDDLRRARVDHLVLTSAAYLRFLDEDARREAHHEVYAAWYREVFDTLPLVADFRPGRWTWGPYIQIRRLPPVPEAGPRHLPAAELFVPDGGMRRPRAVVFFRPGQWAAATADLAAGRWVLHLDGTVAEGAPGRGVAAPGGAGPRLRLGTVDGTIFAETPLAGGPTRFEVAEAGRVHLYLHLPEGSRVTALRLAPLP